MTMMSMSRGSIRETRNIHGLLRHGSSLVRLVCLPMVIVLSARLSMFSEDQ